MTALLDVRLPKPGEADESVDTVAQPDIFELLGETPVRVLPGVVIAGDALVARLPEPEH